jgi:hypothetical protein
MPFGHHYRSRRRHGLTDLLGKSFAGSIVIVVSQDEDRVIATEASSPKLLPGFRSRNPDGRHSGLRCGDGVDLSFADGDEWRVDVQCRSVEHPPSDSRWPQVFVTVNRLAVVMNDASEGCSADPSESLIRNDQSADVLLMARKRAFYDS